MTDPKLPPCRDFICEAAREIRQAPRGKQTAPAGTSVQRIYAVVAASPYSDDDYRAAMMEMIEDGTIVLVCRCTIEGRSQSGYHDTVLDVETVPEWYDFKSAMFETDYEGGQFDRESYRKDGDTVKDFLDRIRGIDHIFYASVSLYVVEDGLPLRAQQAIERHDNISSAKSRAEAILKRMSES